MSFAKLAMIYIKNTFSGVKDRFLLKISESGNFFVMDFFGGLHNN